MCEGRGLGGCICTTETARWPSVNHRLQCCDFGNYRRALPFTFCSLAWRLGRFFRRRRKVESAQCWTDRSCLSMRRGQNHVGDYFPGNMQLRLSTWRDPASRIVCKHCDLERPRVSQISHRNTYASHSIGTHTSRFYHACLMNGPRHVYKQTRIPIDAKRYDSFVVRVISRVLHESQASHVCKRDTGAS